MRSPVNLSSALVTLVACQLPFNPSKMPIVNNELVGNMSDLPFPPTSAGNYIKNLIKKNLQELGDRTWMVSNFQLQF
jgi:hypothetical protein